MNIGTLFVGDTTTALSNAAIDYDSTAVGIINKHLESDVATAYISAGDHKFSDFLHYLNCANEIVYVTIPPSSLRESTLFWLSYVSQVKTVKNLPRVSFTHQIADSRKTDLPQLWNVGCSFTFGHAINKDDRWGQVLGNKLKLESSFLACDGSSVPWATNQILRADIRKGDTVVWGLTGVARIPYYGGEVFEHITLGTLKDSSIKNMVSEKLFVTNHFVNSSIADIEAIVNYSKKLRFNLVLTQFPLNELGNETAMLCYLSGLDNFVHCYTDANQGFIDYGRDGKHPGPKQHEQYANILYNFITERKHEYIS